MAEAVLGFLVKVPVARLLPILRPATAVTGEVDLVAMTVSQLANRLSMTCATMVEEPMVNMGLVVT
jgi:hypothetical protein